MGGRDMPPATSIEIPGSDARPATSRTRVDHGDLLVAAQAHVDVGPRFRSRYLPRRAAAHQVHRHLHAAHRIGEALER
jgi:hypothetical protein